MGSFDSISDALDRDPFKERDFTPSPTDWRDEVIYSVLIDRFSDGKEEERPLLDRRDLPGSRHFSDETYQWRWSAWAASGDRWQGGTINGVRSKLSYLRQLGVTTILLSPVYKQRIGSKSYHGYAIQDFLSVDPRLGTNTGLASFVQCAHGWGMRVLLDVVFHHSGANWIYSWNTPGGALTPEYTSTFHAFGSWLDSNDMPIDLVSHPDAGVWPAALQDCHAYERAGCGRPEAGDLLDSKAEHKRADLGAWRTFMFRNEQTVLTLARCYIHWIALTDCDGMRLDALKHVPIETARRFCEVIKDAAAKLGKQNFLLVGEVAGGDLAQATYLRELSGVLDAVLDIGEGRVWLRDFARGVMRPHTYFDAYDAHKTAMGPIRRFGDRHVSVLDDHDNLNIRRVRFCGECFNPQQVVIAIALQLFSPGLPSIYYGTEQALSGPERSEHKWLERWSLHEGYIREAMFGPKHPRKIGQIGVGDGPETLDSSLPGFGPFGTCGGHVFDTKHPIFNRIAELTATRKKFNVLRSGQLFQREFRSGDRYFGNSCPPALVAWSRILGRVEAVCIANYGDVPINCIDVTVDATINAGGTFTVISNTDELKQRAEHPVDSTVQVCATADGRAFIRLQCLPALEVITLANRP